MTIWTPVLDRSQPLYLAIADAIARDVSSGTLLDGARLPPQRDLAWRLGVTLGTVTRAYKEAEARGLLAGEVGRGSYVRQRRMLTPIPTQNSEAVMDLSQAFPPPVVRPEEFDEALQAVMRDASRLSLLDYAPSDGYPQHKDMARVWLKRSQLDVSAHDIAITAGAHLGLIQVLQAITMPGEKVMAEEVNYALLTETFRKAYVDPVALPIDHEGLLPDAFDHACRTTGAKVIYLVPALQNPTTHTLSRQRREAIVEVARRHDVTIIEDDVFRLLNPRTQPPTLRSLAPERTYHLTSLSKTLAPGLRMGFVVMPQGQERVLKTHLRRFTSMTSGITGEIARHWIETDKATEILTRAINDLAQRRDAFTHVFQGCEFRCEVGAPYAWLKLPAQWTAGRFVSLALQRQVKITPGTAFDLVQPKTHDHVRVCFGTPGPTWDIRKAFEVIRGLMREEPEENFRPVA